MRPNCKYGKSADRETFQAERGQGEHARPHDRAGGLRLSQNRRYRPFITKLKRTIFRL